MMQTFTAKNLREKTFYLTGRHWTFLVAFALMAVYLRSTGPMNDWSGDADSIWTTIKSFTTGSIVPSYVLYKGFFSVFPYVWLYQLSLVFGTFEFFFVKLFHCFLFAYVTAIGFPTIVETLLGINPKAWRKILFIFVAFWMWKNTAAFSQVMVDLPSMTYFVLLVNSAIKLSQQKERNAFRYIYTGLLIGVNMSLSGQYSVASLCVLLYLLIKVFPISELKLGKMPWQAVFYFTILLFGVFVAKGGNTLFEKTVIDTLRSQGGWIPDGGSWLRVGFMGRNGIYRWGAGPTLIDYRGLSILKDMYGENYQKTIDLIAEGKLSITTAQYFQMVAKYPFDYLMKYFNRLFISLSPDGGYASLSRLSVAYTLLFTCLVSIKQRVLKIRDFFKAEILLILSFVFAITAVIILCVEPRYVLQLQGLVFAFAIMDDTLWNGFRSFGRVFRECVINQSLHSLWEKPFPYVFFAYILFIFLCFAHIGSIYETVGVDPAAVLFRF